MRNHHRLLTVILAAIVLGLWLIPASNCANLFAVSRTPAASSGGVKLFNETTGACIGDIVASGSGGLKEPLDFDFGPDGNLFVSDNATGNIKCYDGKTGAFVCDFISGIGAGNQGPNGVQFGPDGNLYVQPYSSGIVQKYSGATGAYMSNFVSGFASLRDFTWTPAGDFVCLSPGENTLYRFAADGTATATYYLNGSSADARFGVDIAASGDIYIAASNIHTIEHYSATGKYLGDLVGPRIGGLSSPIRMRIGPDGNVYTASHTMTTIKKYDIKTGAFLGDVANGLAVGAGGWGFRWKSTGSEVKYGLGQWMANGKGSHRALVKVYGAAEAVRAHIEWRRRDQNPESKRIMVIDSATGQQVTNVVTVDINQVYGEIVFQPSTPRGIYEVYYLPWSLDGASGDAFNVEKYTSYLPPISTADSAWLSKIGFVDAESFKARLDSLPSASLLEIQARTDFDRFDPMEVIATPEEIELLLIGQPDRSYLLFPEDRKNSIRMFETIPYSWVKREYAERFEGKAQPGEIYPFQIGVFAARKDVRNLKLKFSDLVCGKKSIASSQIHCINLGGNDYAGKPFVKVFNVPQGSVRALWSWVEFPKNAKGLYRGTVEVSAEGAETRTVAIEISVGGAVLRDGGLGDSWRLSRLKWLDSTLGIDDLVPAPFGPVKFTGNTVRILNHTISVDQFGLPASMKSGEIEVLAEPIKFTVSDNDRPVSFIPVSSKLLSQSESWTTMEYVSHSTDGRIGLTTRWSMQYDGCLNYEFEITALKGSVPLSDVGMVVPVREDVAKYMIGMRRMGGFTPDTWSWRWNVNKLDNYAWMGDGDAGLFFKLMHETRNAPYDSFRDFGYPINWYNEGQGGCEFNKSGNSWQARAFSGPRTIEPGIPANFKVSFYVTPVKPLDVKNHWSQRYDNNGLIQQSFQGTASNPYINYPFLTLPEIKAKVDHWAKEKTPRLGTNVYYTVRELTNHLPEIWALRSLGNEVYSSSTIIYTDKISETRTATDNPGGHHWLREHLVSGYVPGWNQVFSETQVDAAIGTNGNSRWNNFYVEGMQFLMKQTGIDGLYLDGIGYDGYTMQRIYKVMQRTNPKNRINFHGGNCNHDSVEDGWGHVLPMHIAHLPYLTNCWLGESFNYNQPPDYWFVEVSGIPFGQTSEMLHYQGGGNPYRGMIYGMGGRYLPCIVALWNFWDKFAIQDAEMIGYWSKSCPVKTNSSDVLATVYKKKGKTLIAIASWAGTPTSISLAIDWESLGIDPSKAKLTAPSISDFQDARVFSPSDPIPVEPGKGWLLILE